MPVPRGDGSAAEAEGRASTTAIVAVTAETVEEAGEAEARLPDGHRAYGGL